MKRKLKPVAVQFIAPQPAVMLNYSKSSVPAPKG